MNLTKSKMRVHKEVMTAYSWFIRFLRTSSIRSINNRMFQATNTKVYIGSLERFVEYGMKGETAWEPIFRLWRIRMSSCNVVFWISILDATFQSVIFEPTCYGFHGHTGPLILCFPPWKRKFLSNKIFAYPAKTFFKGLSISHSFRLTRGCLPYIFL